MVFSILSQSKSTTLLLINFHECQGNLLKNHATLKQNKIISKYFGQMLCKINEDFMKYNLNDKN